MITRESRWLLKRSGSIAAAFIRVDAIDDISYPASLVLRELGVILPLFIALFIGQLVGDDRRVGGDYLTFAAIGIAVSAVLQSAMSGFGAGLQRAQNYGTFETFLVEPVPWTFLPVAMDLYRILLGLFSGLLVLVTGLLLGAHYRLSGLPAFLLLLLLGILASMAIGVLSASLMVLAKRSQPILTLYGMAASILAGSLFSVGQLPAWLRVFSWVLPHTYVINATRQVLMDDPGTFVVPVDTAVTALVVFNLVVLSLGTWLFSRSLGYARKMGMLSGY